MNLGVFPLPTNGQK